MTDEQKANQEKIQAAAKVHGVDTKRIWPCPMCGQKNRVDAAEVIARAARPKCGKCGAFLRGPQ